MNSLLLFEVTETMDKFSLQYSCLLTRMNEYLVIDSGGYLNEQPSCINCSVDVCQRS